MTSKVLERILFYRRLFNGELNIYVYIYIFIILLIGAMQYQLTFSASMGNGQTKGKIYQF